MELLDKAWLFFPISMSTSSAYGPSVCVVISIASGARGYVACPLCIPVKRPDREGACWTLLPVLEPAERMPKWNFT